MAGKKIQTLQDRVLKAQEQLGVTLVKERESKRRRRDGRLLKLGVLAEQMFLAGDLTLLSRFEASALVQFKDRKMDRLDFELDEALNYFDKTREDAMVAKAQKNDPAKAPPPVAPGSSPAVAAAAKPAAGPAPRASGNSASAVNGGVTPGAPSTAVSA